MSQPGAGDQSSEEAERRGRLVLRSLPLLLLPVIVVLVSGVVLMAAFGPPPDIAAQMTAAPLAPIAPLVVAVVFSIAVISLVRLRRPTISAILLIAFWSLITTLATLRSGVGGVFPALLIVPICAAGLLLDRSAALTIAGLATLLVVTMGLLQQAGLYTPRDLPGIDPETPVMPAMLFWTFLFITVAALTAQLAGGLQEALRRSRADAAALARLRDELEARVAAQTAQLLAQAEEQATLEERTRLAREIHDTLAQGLTGVVVQLGAAERALAAGDGAPRAEELRTNLELARGLARETLAEARRSVWNLRAPALERGDLGDALRQLAARPPFGQLAVQFTQRGEPGPLPLRVEAALLRVAQEAVANAARHSGAARAELELCYGEGAVELRVRDDGRGFPAAVLRREAGAGGPTGGFGLRGMRERLEAIGGALELANAGGACVVARAPRES